MCVYYLMKIKIGKIKNQSAGNERKKEHIRTSSLFDPGLLYHHPSNKNKETVKHPLFKKKEIQQELP